MDNKAAVITGAGSGIGFQTALELARLGFRVVLGVRTLEKGHMAAEKIRNAVRGADVVAWELDLAARVSIEAFAAKVVHDFPALDVLVNNAGRMTSGFQTTEDGFEMQIGINHFGHFLLTRLLMEPLERASAARVITVASSAHYGGKIDFERFRRDKGRYKGMAAYAQSKLANVLFAGELARRHPGLRSYSLHPGVVASRIVRGESQSWWLALGWNLFKPFSFTPKRGAKTSVFLATVNPAPEPNGQYFDEYQHVMRPSALARDANLSRELWEVTERMWREAGANF